ncbi:UbiA family prenyltransferase [Solitalea lacus]|uniref:UbiA family prenyltransferase n=1 Tax=Solitalea lacus TaxID=2911172 RepID=UPI001EDA6B3E|nr:UbiA family prenyltransferase [Solitalea lacus]UKJ07383.1 UbiA family prenyltransferase [Solitalea lacus]
MKKVFDLFVFGNFWVALCAVAQGLLTYLFIDRDPSLAIIAILFLSTFFIYNIRIVLSYHKIVKNKNAYTSNRMKCVSSHVNTIRLLTYLSAILIIPFAIFINNKSILALSIAAMLAFVYSLPVLKNRHGGLRQIPGAKTVIISLIWASSTVLVPILDSNIHLPIFNISVLFIKRFLLVFCLAIIFDIRDIETDRYSHLKTIANQLGPIKAKRLCYLLLIIHIGLITMYDLPVGINIFLSLLAFLSIVAYLIYKSYPVKSDYFYLFWVDGMFVLQYLLVLPLTLI